MSKTQVVKALFASFCIPRIWPLEEDSGLLAQLGACWRSLEAYQKWIFYKNERMNDLLRSFSLKF